MNAPQCLSSKERERTYRSEKVKEKKPTNWNENKLLRLEKEDIVKRIQNETMREKACHLQLSKLTNVSGGV